ncbi:hypothetical protein HU200_056517 [Digitaria exilis]|uniref:UMP-CMP kinase n=1 Tax=Digitaria exilis TaxID=1010633 RepID=A0A835ARL4_9POAL|nr:hypothetical protein HU200_056517 [Digitaria exilis]
MRSRYHHSSLLAAALSHNIKHTFIHYLCLQSDLIYTNSHNGEKNSHRRTENIPNLLIVNWTQNEVGSFPPGKKITIVFVIGGPGSGKGTQCSMIVKHFGFTHLSAGDLLREEAKSDTEQGMMVKNLMHEGKLVPSELIVKLLLKAMLQSGNDKFLVDGFPRNEENRQAYDKIIGIEPELVLFIDCSKEEMERRILNRNQGRDDDNIDTVRRRFEVFQESTLPVVQHYEKTGKLRRVDGAKSADAVFEDVKAIFVQLNTQANQVSSVSRAQSNPFKRFLDLFCGCFGTQEATN